MGAQRLSKEQELNMVEEYRQGVDTTALLAKYGYATKKSITDKVKKYYPDQYEKIIEEAHINRKGYDYDIETIKTEFDAYFIGLLLTDGYISGDKKIGIDLVDEDCIKFIAQSTGKNTYNTYSPVKTSPDSRIQPKQNRHRVVLYSKSLVEHLKRFGIVPNKTYTLQPPNLKEEEKKFIPYIVRGLIDGDGCVFQTSYGSPAFYITTKSKDFAEWVKKILEENLYMKNINIRIVPDNMYRIETASQDNILNLIALVYNKPFGMERKYKILRKMFRDYNGDFLLEKEEKGIVQTTTERA